jgi:hypothetical protein
MQPDRSPSEAAVTDGFTLSRTWDVWSNQIQHRVEVKLNTVTASTRVLVDGSEVARRGPWHMNVSGFELPFEVDGRPCLLVVRYRYGAQHELELYSDGRSLSTGELRAEHRDVATRDLPNLVRILLLFVPLIGGLNTVVLRPESVRGVLGGWGLIVLVAFSAVVAAVAWWLATRWYARGPSGATRHVVGGAIVAGAWIAYFAGFLVLVSLRPA